MTVRSVNDELVWGTPDPGVYRSTDGRYAIIHLTLPEPDPRDVFLVHATDPNLPNNFGYFVGQERHLQMARKAAERHSWWVSSRPHALNMLDAVPGRATTYFNFPISDGTDRVALTLTCDRGDWVARVLAPVRGDAGLKMGTYAEARFRPPVWVRLRMWARRWL